MSTNKFTQGEWNYDFAKWTNDAPVAGFIIRCEGKDLASFNVNINSRIHEENTLKLGEYRRQHLSEEEAVANCKLIAAAPTMFEALLKVQDFLIRTANYGKEEVSLMKEIDGAINKATL